MKRFLKQDLQVVQRVYGTLTVLASPKTTSQAVCRTDIKTLEIRPGARTSTHYHLLAESVFWILQGEIDVLGTDGTALSLDTGDVLIVPPRELHCLVNRGQDVAIIVETQSPPYAVWDTFPNEKSWEAANSQIRHGLFWEMPKIPQVRVKVCGVRSLDAAIMCAECGVAAVGLNLTYKSKGLRALDQWLEWVPFIPPELSVFVLSDSCSSKEIEMLTKLTGADTIQLQGPMPSEAVREIAQECKRAGVQVVKSVGLDVETELPTATYVEELQEHVDAILLDTSWSGGTGRLADAERLRTIRDRIQIPVILAGGLTSENVIERLKAVPAIAVDVESGVEVRVGAKDGKHKGIAVKSASRVRGFMDALRKA